jgi:outer membrane receptor protein involved in Fe transport
LKTRDGDKKIGAALLLAAPLLGWAQAGEGKAQLERVQVQGEASAQALRRESVGALVVLGREELLRHGDTRLSDALQRMPGLSVVNNGSRGAEIRMSGLGGGYTQLLLNGEPVPPGFSLESLSPELIERVEVSRAPSVAQSSQAIAGSVNIVLRRVPRAAQRELKLGLANQFDRPSANADLQLGDRAGALAWGLGLGVASDKLVWPMALQQQVLDPQGRLIQAYGTDKREFDHSYRLTLAPRASWTLSPGESLGSDHLLRIFSSHGGALDRRSNEFGPAPQQARNDLLIAAHGYSLRSRVNWQRKEDDGQQWELKLGLTRNQRDSHADFDGYDFDGRWIRDALVQSLAVDQVLSLAGRWRRSAGEAHQLSLGWDGEQSQRNEDRLQREQQLPGGLPVENLDEVYQARVRRLALFVQDEWEIASQWQATLGLRWEGLHTRSEGNVFEGVTSRASVLSPVAQLLWKLPASRDQLRLGLARSYKAPTPRELMPRRFVANNNSPTTPDLQGNPALRPELAWSLDLGWSHPLGSSGKAGQLGINAYAKRIANVVVEDLLQAANGAWVQTRANRGQAEVQGVELEARLAVQQLWPGLPALDLRANLAFNRSRVAAVPGPDNRLAQQTPASLNLGLDHRVAGTALSWGGNLNLQAGGPQRQSETRFIYLPSKRVLDLYALWKAPAGGSQWRASLSHLLHPDEVTQRRVLVQGSENLLEDRWRSGMTVRLQFERPL